MNCIPPVPGFLETLREVCDQHGTVLIFDEVMTGFRVARGGAQGLYGITPDLTALGKIIGGGMPVGAFGGRRDIMENISPLGPVYQAGTLSGNPIAMTAGLKTLELLSAPGFHEPLSATTERLTSGMQAGRRAGVPLSTNRAGGMFGIFFTADGPVTNFEQATACNQEQFNAFFHAMLERGVYLAPSAFEAGFVSAAHGDAEIDATLTAAAEVLRRRGRLKERAWVRGRPASAGSGFRRRLSGNRAGRIKTRRQRMPPRASSSAGGCRRSRRCSSPAHGRPALASASRLRRSARPRPRPATAPERRQGRGRIPVQVRRRIDLHLIRRRQRRGQCAACTPRRMVFERGSSTAMMRASPTRRRSPCRVLAMAVGWWAKSS
jgi:hypothetical protein